MVNKMKLSYDEIFRYSDVLNPVSLAALFSAGKLAELEPEKTVLDLGSGKGFPSLFWASTFGVQVEGFDISKKRVEYANSRAKMLNLSHRAKYFCQDIRELKLNRKYDVVASLGLGIVQAYGDIASALKIFKTIVHKNGVLVLAEPVWLVKPVSQEVLKSLGEAENSFQAKLEMQQLIEKCGFKVLGHFVSSKEDWESYVRPVYIAMHEIVENRRDLAEEAQRIVNGFKAEYDAVGQYWNMLLWVAKVN